MNVDDTFLDVKLDNIYKDLKNLKYYKNDVKQYQRYYKDACIQVREVSKPYLIKAGVK